MWDDDINEDHPSVRRFGRGFVCQAGAGHQGMPPSPSAGTSQATGDKIRRGSSALPLLPTVGASAACQSLESLRLKKSWLRAPTTATIYFLLAVLEVGGRVEVRGSTRLFRGCNHNLGLLARYPPRPCRLSPCLMLTVTARTAVDLSPASKFNNYMIACIRRSTPAVGALRAPRCCTARRRHCPHSSRP